ncbi:MAG: endoglucanase A, partial [Vicinamibacteria bacterium]
LDLHWYPEAQGGGVRITDANDSSAVAAARVQAPRSLWDPSYVETSWISTNVGAIRLLPRLRDKIAEHYPGTRVAFTEYNYGGPTHISGVVAEADVLGILGREGVFAANLWPLVDPAQQPAIDAAFDAYRNYDGAGSAFGDTSVLANTSDAGTTSVYASVDSEGGDRLVIVAINKASAPGTAEVTASHSRGLGHAQVYRIAAVGPPMRQADLAIASLAFTDTLPPLSVTVYVLRP